MNGLDPQTQALVDQHMTGLGYTPPTTAKPPEIHPQLKDYVDQYMVNIRGYEKPGEVYEPLKKEVPPMEEAVARIPQEEVKAYMDKPGFWQQMMDMARLVGERDPHTLVMGLESLGQGISLGNFPYVVDLIGNIAGTKNLYRQFKMYQDENFQKKLGYIPDPEAKVFATAPAEMAGALATLGGIIRAADVPAKLISKVPLLRSLGRGTITGIVTGLTQRPEEESIWNRLKQVPGNVAFFALIDAGVVSANQLYKIYRWNKQFGGKAPKYKVGFDVYEPPPITIKEQPYVMSKEEFYEFLHKIHGKPGPDGMPQGLTSMERQVFEQFKGRKWGDLWKEVRRTGEFRTVVDVEVKPPTELRFGAEDIEVFARKPKISDILRRTEVRFGQEIPRGEMPFEEPRYPEWEAGKRWTERAARYQEKYWKEPYKEPLRKPGVKEAPRPGEPPPPPEKAPPPQRGAPPSVVVRPTPEGGWRFDFEPEAARPTPVEPGIVGRPTPTGIIPWIPRELPPAIKPPIPEIPPEPGVAPPRPRKPAKAKKFKDPMLQWLPESYR